MWNKRDDMIVRGEQPYNAEPPPSVLASSEITPLDAFYARNHGPFPDIPVEQWQLTVAGLVDRPLSLTYDDLTTNFPQHWVVAEPCGLSSWRLSSWRRPSWSEPW